MGVEGMRLLHLCDELDVLAIGLGRDDVALLGDQDQHREGQVVFDTALVRGGERGEGGWAWFDINSLSRDQMWVRKSSQVAKDQITK